MPTQKTKQIEKLELKGGLLKMTIQEAIYYFDTERREMKYKINELISVVNELSQNHEKE